MKITAKYEIRLNTEKKIDKFLSQGDMLISLQVTGVRRDVLEHYISLFMERVESKEL